MNEEKVEIKKEKWCINVDDNKIHVENKASSLKLLVNGKMQDIQLGLGTFDNVRLYGKLPNKKK